MKRLLLLVLLIFPCRSWAADAATCENKGGQTDVQNAIDATSSGGTVNVPAGNCTWDVSVTITGKALTLRGAGVGLTNITDNGNLSYGLAAEVSATNFLDVSGFTFIKSADHTNGIVQIYGATATGTFQNGFRFHHNRILQASEGARGIYAFYVYGLIDHNTIDVTSATGSIQSITVQGSTVSGADYGYTPWGQALSFGTNNAVYIEDNTVTYGSQAEEFFDGTAGARAVIRYNTITGNNPGWHGMDSGFQRSVFSVEMYGNTLTNSSGNQMRGATIRGGTALFFDNTFGGSIGYSSFVMTLFRATVAGVGYTWGYCDGTNWDITSPTYVSESVNPAVVTTGGTAYRFDATHPDDKSLISTMGTRYLDGSGSHGYPCRDQPGRTHDQVLAPLYEWNNGSHHFGVFDGGGPYPPGNVGQPTTTWLAENREYYNYTLSFDGTTGVGRGTRASRPATCTTGVAYWSTDQGGNWNKINGAANDGTLDKCTATNTWSNATYTPYTYPHPLVVDTPVISFISPSTGTQGATNLSIALTGSATAWMDNVTLGTFSGTGITVNFTDCVGLNSCTVNIDIAANATTGPRTLTMTTNAEIETTTFTVNPPTAGTGSRALGRSRGRTR